MMKKLVVGVFAVGVLASSGALANEGHERSSIESDLQRLVCFDAAFPTIAKPTRSTLEIFGELYTITNTKWTDEIG